MNKYNFNYNLRWEVEKSYSEGIIFQYATYYDTLTTYRCNDLNNIEWHAIVHACTKSEA